MLPGERMSRDGLELKRPAAMPQFVHAQRRSARRLATRRSRPFAALPKSAVFERFVCVT